MIQQHKFCAEMCAYALGHSIEVNYPWCDSDDWREINHEGFSPHWNMIGVRYRIKEESSPA